VHQPDDDSTLSAFGDFIRAQRRLAHISQRHLAKVTGMSDSYVSQLERGLYRPSAQVAKALADAFGISPAAMYTRLGLLDEESAPATAGVEQAIQDDLLLGPDEKKALVLMYQTLVERGASPS
jgi:transcriptional regulator with XRE-family HTH domain